MLFLSKKKAILIKKRLNCLTKLDVIMAVSCIVLNSTNAQQDLRNYAAPSQLGMTGLIYTPSAYLPKWGMLDFGFTHYHKNAAFTFGANEYSERSFLTNMVFLPFMEFSLKLTKPYTTPVDDNYGLGDRSISIRAQVLKERTHLPAILIGVQDMLSSNSFFKTNYIVFTKKVDIKQFVMVTSLGYGYSPEEALGDYLQGTFGGVQVYWKTINLLAEYDTDQFNLGLGYQFKKMLFLKTALVNGRYFSGSINLRFFIR